MSSTTYFSVWATAFEALPTNVSINQLNSRTAKIRQSTKLTAIRRSANPVAIPGIRPPTIMPIKTSASGFLKRNKSREKARIRNTTQNDEMERAGMNVV